MKPIKKISVPMLSTGSRLRRSAIAMLAATAMLAGSIAPVSALSLKEVIEYKIFAFQCAVLLITDPIAHLSVCGEGDTSNVAPLKVLFFVKGIECQYDDCET